MPKSERHVKAAKARWKGVSARQRSRIAAEAAGAITSEAARERTKAAWITRKQNTVPLDCRVCGRPARSNSTPLCEAHYRAELRASKP